MQTRKTKTNKYTARKHGGDDAYSWAIFRNNEVNPMISGLMRSEVNYYKNRCKELDESRNA